MRAGLATPPQFCWYGPCRRFGGLFWRGDGLKMLADVKAIAPDKTGTLTVGCPCHILIPNPRTCIRACLVDPGAPIRLQGDGGTAWDIGATVMEVQDSRAAWTRVMGSINGAIWRIGCHDERGRNLAPDGWPKAVLIDLRGKRARCRVFMPFMTKSTPKRPRL